MSTGFTKVVTFGLGSVILGSLFKTKQQKPTVQRIGELSEQTAKEGEPRPIVWGRVRPISGNIMHSSTPRIIRREVKQQSSGGKGGSKKQPKQYEERVFRTYAIRICEGPVTAIMRVWRNNKLVYDARGNEWGEKNNGVFLNRARFYLGGWSQMPDTALESLWGAGNVPAYRGTCYMVVPDEDLTELGGAVPQYIFEVERAEGVPLTSLIYNVESIDSSDSKGADLLSGGPVVSDSAESTGFGLLSGELIVKLKDYVDWPAEPLVSGGMDILAADLRSLVKDYSNWPNELAESQGLEITGGQLRVAVINYENWPFESIDSTGLEVTGGSLT